MIAAMKLLPPVALAVICGFSCTGIIGQPGSPAGGGGGGGGESVHSNQCAASSAAPPTTRVRRLTKVEIQNATTAMLSQSATSALSNLDADSQINGGFSNSAALVVSDSFASGLNTAADTIATQFKATVTTTSYDKTCFSTDTAAETCAKTFIRSFGAKAFRRPITDGDVTGLFAVYQAGRDVGIDG